MKLFAFIVAMFLLATVAIISWVRGSRCTSCAGRFAWRKTGARRTLSGLQFFSNGEAEYRCRHCGAVEWRKIPKGPVPWLGGSGGA
jgi:hypothetical protein